MSDMPAAGRRDYLVVDSPYELARWRPLVNWLLSVPQIMIASALGRVSSLVFLVYWVKLLFTGRLDKGMYSLMTMSERYNERAAGYLLGWSETYPPWDFTPGPVDNGAYPPVRLRLPDPPETAPKSAALNVLKAIPHYIVLIVFAIGALVVGVVAWFAVLFTGRWPRGMRDFLVRFTNYYFRVWTYVAMVDDDYPKFGLT